VKHGTRREEYPMTEQPLYILLVDDDPNIRDAVRRELSRASEWHIAEAEDVPAGLAHMSRHRVDVLVCDYEMPVMTGLEMLQKVRERHPDVVRVLLTGHADLHLALRALNEGLAHRFLAKPWNDVNLRQVVLESVESFAGDRVEG
jgi:adenylate cyclase